MVETLVYSDEVSNQLASASEKETRRVLFLEQHPEYPTHFLVNSFDPLYPHKLKDLIGPYRAISMFKLDPFIEKAEEEGYKSLVFTEDPSPVFNRVASLNEPYPYSLGGIELRKFQIQGFNYLRDNKSDIVNWSTGAGKSVFAVAKAKYLLNNNLVDKVVVASRNHNKINWQRTFRDIGELDATVVDSAERDTSSRREDRKGQYADPIIIVNYEKFRFRGKRLEGQTRESVGDGEEILPALKKQRVYFIWDEMPTKLKNPSTATFKGAKKLVQATKDAYQSMLSATPLENAPEDIYACVKILTLKTNEKIFTTLTDFRRTYAASMNPWARWQVASWDMEALQEMGLRLAHITHQADKYRDPEIRAQFPVEHWEDIIIDMSPQDRKLYQIVEKKIREEFGAGYDEILSKLLVLQLICDNPATLTMAQSELAKLIVEKKEPTDRHCAKLETLHDLLDQIGGKVVLFTMYNDLGAKLLAKYVGDWGFSYVLFDGGAKKKQNALDRFKSDRRIKVFISSDQGSDSINLEQATTVINYDLPWKHSTLTQRVNRINRITSESEHVFYYNLIMANTMEERKIKLLKKKKSWEDAVFRTDIADQAEVMSTMSKEDLFYLLLGEEG